MEEMRELCASSNSDDDDDDDHDDANIHSANLASYLEEKDKKSRR